MTSTSTDSRPERQRPIGFWLKLVDRLIDGSFDELLGQAGLTRRHWQVLNLLRAAPTSVGQADARLAPFLAAGEPTTAPVLDDLHARGWVAWADPEQAVLTEAGSAAHATLAERVAHNRARLAAGIAPAEYAATVEVLRRMAVNLGWAGSP